VTSYARVSLLGLTLEPPFGKTKTVVRPIQHACHSAAGASSKLYTNSNQHHTNPNINIPKISNKQSITLSTSSLTAWRVAFRTVC
jgi:hypothetical protein